MGVHASYLLAFGFFSPWLLWGLALAGLPVLIHLMHRRQYRETDWAAMEFLRRAIKKQARRLRFDSLLLLLVRTMIIVLVALAFAQPFLNTPAGTHRAGQPVHRLIILDASLSMAQAEGGGSSMDAAKVAIEKLVSSGQQGDAWQLVQIAGPSRSVVIAQPSFDQRAVLEEVANLRPTAQFGDVPRALADCLSLLDQAPEIPRKEVHILSDFQQSNWRPTAAPGTQIDEQILQLSERARVITTDVGLSSQANRAVVDVELIDRLARTARPIRIAATIVDFSQGETTRPSIELHIDGRLHQTKTVPVRPGVSTRVEFMGFVETPGDHQFEVRLPDDLIIADNKRRLALPVVETIRVLLVDGGTISQSRVNRATDYLQTALAPGDRFDLAGVAGTGTHDVTPIVISDGELASHDLHGYDCIWLCNVELLSPAEATRLTLFVEDGGGLVVSVGPHVQLAAYNRLLREESQGLLPATFDTVVTPTEEGGSGFTFEVDDETHPIVEPFRGAPDAGLLTTTTDRYIKLSVPTDLDAQVPVRFSSSDPAVVTAGVGEGRVVLLATSVDDTWGQWPLWPSFVPMVHETVAFATRGQIDRRQRQVGDVISRTYAAQAFNMPVTLHRPDGSQQRLRIEQQADASVVQSGPLLQAGFYRIEFGPPINNEERIAVNVDPRESDPAAVSPDEFALDTPTFPSRGVPSAQLALHAERAFSPWLLLAAIGLLMVEQTMAWNMSIGRIALAVAAAIVLLGIALVTDSIWLRGLVSAAVAVGGVIMWQRRARAR